MSSPWIRAAVPSLALLIAAAPLHAEPEPVPPVELREPKEIWPDMRKQLERIESVESGGKYDIPAMVSIEGSVNELAVLLHELQLSINDHPVPKSWEQVRIIKINTGIRFLGQEVSKLRSTAYLQTPATVGKEIGMVRLRMWTLEIRFPKGYLPEPPMKKPAEVMENDRSLPPELR